jgi:hypothetical protein
MRVRSSFGLALGLAFACNLGLARAEAADSEAQAHARQEYAAGVAAFQQGDHEQARAHFSAADAAFPSPSVKLMLGRALLRLGQLVAAHAALTAAVREAQAADSGQRYEQAARAADEELQQLAQHLATIHVRVDDPTGSATLRVGKRAIPRDAWQEPIVSEPGSIELALDGPDGRRDVKQLELSGGAAATLAMSVPEAPPPAAALASAPTPAAALPTAPAEAVSSESRGQTARSMGYVAAGVGVAGIVAFGVLGSMSNAQFNKLNSACPTRMNCDPALEDHATQGRTYQALANVSLGVGIAALAAGVVLWVIGLPDEQRPSSASAARLSGTF